MIKPFLVRKQKKINLEEEITIANFSFIHIYFFKYLSNFDKLLELNKKKSELFHAKNKAFEISLLF